MKQSSDKIKVIHFQRKPRSGFNFSIEGIFEGIRNRLKDKINFSVKYCSHFNDGYLSKLRNIIKAAFRYNKKAVNHITGEVYFINLLMPKKKVLLTIHDCRFIERKKGVSKKLIQWLYLKLPVRNAGYITTVSETTKLEVIKYTACDPKKIRVIPVGINPVFKPALKAFNKDRPVILQVGAAENKNLARLADALRNIACDVVIIGEPAVADIEKFNQYNISYTVKTNLSTEALYLEYANADIVSFISMFEGFGMPIAEANCVERVVITSNISSMPEVAGKAACLVDPFNVEDMRRGFLKLIYDDNYREQLIAYGRDNRKRFDDNVIADMYYRLYKEIALSAKLISSQTTQLQVV